MVSDPFSPCMLSAGVWTLTLQMQCPWMMLISMTTPLQFTLSDKNGTTWTTQLNSTSTSSGYRSCATWSLDMGIANCPLEIFTIKVHHTRCVDLCPHLKL